MTSCAGSLRPRESTGNSEDKAGDSIFCTKKKAANFFTNSLALVIVWAAFATNGKTGSRSLLPVPHAAFTKGFQLRNNCGCIFHNLVHVVNDQTTSSFDFSTLSLRPRESIESIVKAGDSTYNTKTQTANFFTNSLALVNGWACQFLRAFVSMDIVRPTSTTKGKKGSRSLLPVQLQATTVWDTFP